MFVPNFGPFGDPAALVELAEVTEQAGWDGLFIWDHINWNGDSEGPVADPWVALGAVALATTKLRIGTMITPLPRRRPWKLARETTTVDALSGGRLNLGVGLGYPPDLEFGAFGEETADRARAGMLDEGLAILDGLWSGEEFSYTGEHFSVEGARFPAPARAAATDSRLVRGLVAQPAAAAARGALGRSLPRARRGRHPGARGDQGNRRLRARPPRERTAVRHRDRRLLG